MEYAGSAEILTLMRIRRKTGWSLDNLAESLGISKSELSRMETGKRKMPRDLFTEALRALGIAWNFAEYEGLEDRFRLVNQYLYEMESVKARELLNELLEQEAEFRYSSQYFWWSLVDFFNEILFRPNLCTKDEIDELEKEVMSFQTHFPEDMQILIMDLRYFRKGDKNLEYLDSPIREIGNATTAGTMLLFHRYQKMVKVSSFFEVMELYDRLENRLKQDRNFKRLIEADILKSILFTRMGEFDAAEKILLQTYNLAEKIAYKEPERKIFENLMWNALRSKEYRKFLACLRKEYELYPERLSGGNVILAPYSLYMSGESEKAVQAIAWIHQNLRTDPFEERTLLMTEDLILDRPKMFVRHSESCLKEAKKNNDCEIVSLLLQIQAEFYEKKKDWENAYKKLKAIRNGRSAVISDL